MADGIAERFSHIIMNGTSLMALFMEEDTDNIVQRTRVVQKSMGKTKSLKIVDFNACISDYIAIDKCVKI